MLLKFTQNYMAYKRSEVMVDGRWNYSESAIDFLRVICWLDGKQLYNIKTTGNQSVAPMLCTGKTLGSVYVQPGPVSYLQHSYSEFVIRIIEKLECKFRSVAKTLGVKAAFCLTSRGIPSDFKCVSTAAYYENLYDVKNTTLDYCHTPSNQREFCLGNDCYYQSGRYLLQYSLYLNCFLKFLKQNVFMKV